MSNKQNQKLEYLLLFRGGEWDKALSPEEIQKVTDDWMAWIERISEKGQFKTGQPLERTGKWIGGKERKVSDGPFAESKEVVGGYFLLEVNNEEEAVQIARECPGLPYGQIVEVRPVAEECPLVKRSKAEAVQAGV